MIDKELHVSNLIFLELNATATDAERMELQSWINASADNLAFYRQLTDQYHFQHELKMFRTADTDRIWELTKSGLAVGNPDMAPVSKRFKLWPRMAAAIAIVMVGAGLFYYKLNVNREQLEQIAYRNDIVPGKTGATLTLANGKKISLGDVANGELAKEAGVVITKSVNGELVYEIKNSKAEANQINTLSTAKGETYQVHLPDGSTVWLNAASSLTYSANLTAQGKRKVWLQGEGYFEIARDKAHPFIVESKGQEVEVLGTHFNVKAYNDETTVQTTLLKGSVKINKEAVLKPGQQSVVKDAKLIKIISTDTEEAVAWKEGEFFFDQENFESTMNMIARWYNVDIVYDHKPVGLHIAGQISRKRTINEVLDVLQNTDEVKFKIEGRRIRVIK